MTKGIKAAELVKRQGEGELLQELKKQREELQNIRFTKVSGTAVAKLSKIKVLRKNIARILTVINNNSKQKVIRDLRNRFRKEGEEVVLDRTVKNLKAKRLPTNLRMKKTRAMRRALTKSQDRKVNVRVLKQRLNFPLRKFAVPLK